MKNKKHYTMINALTKRLLAIGTGNLVVAALLILVSLDVYQQSVTEHIENERCLQDPSSHGWCRIS